MTSDLGLGSAAAAKLARDAGAYLQWGRPAFDGTGLGNRTYAPSDCEDLPDA